MKKIILNIEKGVSDEYKAAAKKAVEDFLELFPEYKDKFEVSTHIVDSWPSEYLTADGKFNIETARREVSNKKYEAGLHKGKDDSEIPIEVFIPNRSLSYGFGVASANHYAAVSATTAWKPDRLKRLIIHEFGHLFGATYDNRIHTDANTAEAQRHGTHCADSGDIMAPYPQGTLETCDIKKPFCNCCMGAMRTFMGRMHGVNEKTETDYPVLSKEDAEWLRANTKFRIDVVGNLGLRTKEDHPSATIIKELEAIGRRMGLDEHYPFSLVYKRYRELGIPLPDSHFGVEPRMPDDPTTVQSTPLPAPEPGRPVNHAFKKPFREFWKSVSDSEQGSKYREELASPHYRATITKSDGSRTTLEASENNHLSLSAEDAQGNPKIPEYKYFQNIAAHLKSKNSDAAFGNIADNEFKARLLAACLEAGVKTIGAPEANEAFLRGIDPATKAKIETLQRNPANTNRRPPPQGRGR